MKMCQARFQKMHTVRLCSVQKGAVRFENSARFAIKLVCVVMRLVVRTIKMKK